MPEPKTGQAMEAITQGDAELRPIIPMFVAEMQGYVVAIEQALKTRNFGAIQALGHTIKGTAGYFGIDSIIDIGRSLE